jgi:spore coat protein A, manganese oxidase
MKNSLFTLFALMAMSATAQTTLDPVVHPKFQTAITFPTKINLASTGTNVFEMAQTTQSLGLVAPITNTPLTTTVWGYGPVGTPSYPGPTLLANSNVPVNVEWRNNLPATHLLPVDATYHVHLPTTGIPTVVHLHGGHSEDASDGQPDAWYNTGYAQKGTAWKKNVYTYDNSQEGAMLWYHDHALGATRLNVYAGLAGMYLLNDANDQALPLPRGNYERELLVQDRMFTSTGQLFLPTDPAVVNGGMPEFFGNFILVNGKAWPFMNVEPRKYRFRVVNASDSRVYVFGLSNNAAFLQIGSDGGKFNNPKSLTKLTLAPGERSDIIIDFAGMTGSITLQNSGSDTPFGNIASVPVSPTSPTGQVMQFNVNQPLNTAIANPNITTATNLRPNLGVIPTLGVQQKTRQLGLFEGTDNLGRIMPMLGIIDPAQPTLNGSLLWHDVVTENVNLNDTETWEIYNTTADAHPIHVHLVSFQILSKQTFTGTMTAKTQLMHTGTNGGGWTLSNIALTGVSTTYAPNDLGWKDTHILMPGEMMRIKARYDRVGEYVWHCHILSHEDHDMMRKLVVVNNVPCVGDVTPPILTACPANIALTTTGTTAIAPHWTLPTASDNCSTPSVTFTTSPTAGLTHGGPFPIGVTTVTYKATDANGNISTCSFTVTVTSSNTGGNVCTTPASNIVGTANAITVSGITTSSAIIQVLNSSFSSIYNQQVNTTSATVPNLVAGSYTVNLTVLNAGGIWPAVCTIQQVVTVGGGVNPCTTDVTPPVITCPANINLTTTGTTATGTYTTPTATDNCTTPTVSLTAGLASGSAFPIGTTTVTYTAIDGKNNSATCSFNVIVTAQTGGANICTNPTANIVGGGNAITISGIATSSAIIQVLNSSFTNVYNQQIAAASITIPNLPAGSYTVNVTVLNAGGIWPAVCSVQQVVIVTTGSNPCTTDVTPPVITCPVNINLTTTGTTAIAAYTTPTATDNCTSPTVSRTAGLASGSAFPIGTTTVTYTAIDGNNNSATCSFNVIVTAQTGGANICTNPTANIIGGGNAITISGIATSSAIIQVLNSSFTNVYNQQIAATSTTIPNLPAGSYTVNVTVLNAGGIWPAVCTLQQVVTVTAGVDPCATDVIPPVLTACPANLNLTTTGTTAVATWTAPTATDNCSTPSVSFTTSPTIGLTRGGAFPIGTTTVTYKATDAKNNVATCTFTVTVANNCTAFVNSAVTEYNINNVAWVTASSVTVNVGARLSISANPNTLPSYTWTGPNGFAQTGTTGGDVLVSAAITTAQAGTYTVVLKDASGCTATKSIVVTVNNPCASDVTPPVFTYCPPTVSVPIGLLSVCRPGTWTTPTATDNCGVTSLTQTSGSVSGTCFIAGNYAITYTARDARGNRSTCNFSVNAYKTFLPGLLKSSENLVMMASAEPNRVLIEWLNNTGYKNDFFTIEKINPTTGQFEALAIKNSESTDTTATNYVEFDELPFEGDNTYRVKVTFKDGTYKYSAEQTVQFSGAVDVRIFPNPANDPVNIDLRVYRNQAVNISLYNSIGQLVLNQKVEKVVNTLLELSIGKLYIGTYRIRIESKGKRDVLKALVIMR